MANIGFNNIKVALAFAGMTILGALTMVGTSENKGALAQIANASAERRDDNNSNYVGIDAVSGESTTMDAPEPEWAYPSAVDPNAYIPPEGLPTDPSEPGFPPAPSLDSGDPATEPLSPSAITSSTEYDDYRG